MKEMLRNGAIGTVREVHNWTNRPIWPQYNDIPTDRPPVPKSFNWDLWLGPAAERSYHPHYTHMVFRGWHDFGGGSIADMGNYSLWPIWMTLDLPAPNSVEAMSGAWVEMKNQMPGLKANDFSFPFANMIRFTFPGTPIVLTWYDGGLRPPTPVEVRGMAQPPRMGSGTMYVGDKGIILGGQIYPEKLRAEYYQGRQQPQPKAKTAGARGAGGAGAQETWLVYFKGGRPDPGNLIDGANCAEGIALAGAATRFARSRFAEEPLAATATGPMEYDTETMSFTNFPEANQYLVREYREGWNLTPA